MHCCWPTSAVGRAKASPVCRPCCWRLAGTWAWPINGRSLGRAPCRVAGWTIPTCSSRSIPIRVTFINNRAEMGQGIRTSLAMVAADELGAQWGKCASQQVPMRSTVTKIPMARAAIWRPDSPRCGLCPVMLQQAAARRWGAGLGSPRRLAQDDPSGHRAGAGLWRARRGGA